jgi:hypothetical protein
MNLAKYYYFYIMFKFSDDMYFGIITAKSPVNIYRNIKNRDAFIG